MTRRRLAVALLAAVAAAPLNVAPATARAVTMLDAAATMVVTADAPVYTRLHVPRPVRLSLNYWSKKQAARVPRFSPGATLGAIVIASDDDADAVYVAARLPQGARAVQRLVSLGPDLCQVRRYCELAPGTYRLYVMTERPVEVTLKLEGLRGTTSIAPGTPAVGEVGGPTHSYYHSTPQSGAEAAAHGAGMAATVAGKSNLVFSGFWFAGPHERFAPAPADRPPLQIGDAGACFLYDHPPASEAFAPGCPTGSMLSNHSTWRALSDFAYLEWVARWNLEAGDYAWGNFAVHTGIRQRGFVGFWLSLD
ncbi:MAG: hypothetical protein ABR613_06210 [Actinomycetota bacterium]